MRKFAIYFLVLALVIAMCVPICAYAEEDAAPVLPDDVRSAIIKDYAAANEKYGVTEDIVRIAYFGEYESCHVAFVDYEGIGYFDVMTTIEVAGYSFVYTCKRELDVYKDGEFLKLSKAYEAGWLSDEAVGRLWNYYTNGIYELPKTGDTVLLPALLLLTSAAALPLFVKYRTKY